jgi:hypothetical protein
MSLTATGPSGEPTTTPCQIPGNHRDALAERWLDSQYLNLRILSTPTIGSTPLLGDKSRLFLLRQPDFCRETNASP